jgi:HSP20 family molecular chaperone IbpA
VPGPVRVPGADARPGQAGNITAALADAVLTVTVPRAGPESRGRIQITAG